MLSWLLWNTVVASALALVVWAIARRNAARPALCHLLWLLVFVALVAPPLPLSSAPGALLRDGLASWVALPDSSSSPTSPGAERASWEPPLDTSIGTTDPALVATKAETRDMALGAPTSTSRIAALAAVPLEVWLLIAWALGTLCLLVRDATHVRAFQRNVALAETAAPGLLASVSRVARRFGIATPGVSLMRGVGSPSVWCFGRARLLWPADDLDADVGEPALIAHELAHIARRDHWVARGEALAKLLLWWHPLFWIVRRQVHDYSELSCDAWALWAYPSDRRAYAEALIDAQDRNITAPLTLRGLCATGRDVKDFERRLNMIMSRNVSRRVSKGAAALALLATTLVLPGFSDDTGTPAASRNSASEGAIAGLVDSHLLTLKAEALFEQGEFEKARQVFEKLLHVDPDNGLAHRRMGYLLISSGGHERALKHLSRQLALGHEPALGAYNMACAHALSGEKDAALSALDKAVKLGFRDAKLLAHDVDLASLHDTKSFAKLAEAVALSAKLREKLTAQQWGKAAETLAMQQSLADIVTLDGKTQHSLGLALLKEGREADAEVAFARQAEAGYLPANAYYNIACARALSGETERAFEALTKSAKLGMNHAEITDDPDLASLHADARFAKLAGHIQAVSRGKESFTAALKHGELDSAVALVAAMPSDEPAAAKMRGWAAFALAEALTDADRGQDALAQLDIALENGYPAAKAVFGMARVHARTGANKRALRHLDDAVTLGFADGAALTKLFTAYSLGDEATRQDLLARALAAWGKSDAKSKSRKTSEEKKSLIGQAKDWLNRKDS